MSHEFTLITVPDYWGQTLIYMKPTFAQFTPSESRGPFAWKTHPSVCKRFQVDSNLWGNWRSAAGSKDFQ